MYDSGSKPADVIEELRTVGEVIARTAGAAAALLREADVLRTLAAATRVEMQATPGLLPRVIISFADGGQAVAHMFAADAARRAMQAAADAQ